MKTLILIFKTGLVALGVLAASAGLLSAENDSATSAPIVAEKNLADLAHDAISEEAAVSAAAINALRDAGPEGLQALFDTHAELVKKNAATGKMIADPEWQRFRAAADTIGKQRDDYASQLYWFTNFEKAKAAAKASGRPILSLRLLGKLDEEFSCANSRFFRTILYANADVSRHLREHFVLHWESVRPVPKVSIDFGDGRVMNCTVTGNSIHYILDAEGRPFDALPGLYGPAAFLRGLTAAEEIITRIANQDAESREKALREFHRVGFESTLAQWRGDLATLGIAAIPRTTGNFTQRVANAAPPTALRAQPLAISKMGREIPLVRAITSQHGNTDESVATGLAFRPAPTRETLSGATDDAAWKKIAQLHADDARLDERSKALMVAKNPSALDASRVAIMKRIVENPLLRVVRTLERSTAEDTVRNEYLFHTTIHQWFLDGSAPADLKELNARVYAELFLTPDSDPWLGLKPADVYSALPNDGIAKP